MARALHASHVLDAQMEQLPLLFGTKLPNADCMEWISLSISHEKSSDNGEIIHQCILVSMRCLRFSKPKTIDKSKLITMKRSEIRNKVLEEEMSEHIRQYRLKGLSQIEYCRRNNIGYAKMFYWIRKERNANRTQN